MKNKIISKAISVVKENSNLDDFADIPAKLKCNNNPTSNTAITLIALIITIIVLLILAGITISMVMGDTRNI